MSNVYSKHREIMRRADAARAAMVADEIANIRASKHTHQTDLDYDDDDYDDPIPKDIYVPDVVPYYSI